ncbi:MAG: NAD kinase [Actinobacteria bacterium]|nr:NAD kinase [Actinomycetota bacterium]NDE83447.1 NAD kinase [Actinomycetota bacterium]
MTRSVILVLHPSRPEAHDWAAKVVRDLNSRMIDVFTASEIAIDGAKRKTEQELKNSVRDSELVLVLGGDGTILRGTEIAHGSDVPVLGVNLGHVGFLAQIQRPSIESLVDAIDKKLYKTERRMTLSYKIERKGVLVGEGWALNEVAIERNTESMIELFVQIDHRPLSRWGCDGVICATPTGSTAYAFSAGGPVVWPDVEALVLLPLAAHALFSDPMVVSPESEIAIDVESDTGVISADGLRKFQLNSGDRVLMTSEKTFVSLALLEDVSFTDRLVAKFKLPVDGWRGE